MVHTTFNVSSFTKITQPKKNVEKFSFNATFGFVYKGKP